MSKATLILRVLLGHRNQTHWRGTAKEWERFPRISTRWGLSPATNTVPFGLKQGMVKIWKRRASN